MTRADDDDDIQTPNVTIGAAEPGSPDPARAVAVLWVPDPEQRHGIREFYVYPASLKEGRPLGFRKPGEPL